MAEKTTYTEAELRERLTPEQYEVTQNAGTERAFTGIYHDTKDKGIYHCIVCDTELFDSDTKYDSGSGWPSFYQPIEDSTRSSSTRTGATAWSGPRSPAPTAAPTSATCSPTAPSRPVIATA